MTTGLDWQDTDSTIQELYLSQDWVQFVLDKPITQSPGNQFNYYSGCSHVLSAIIQKTTGMNTRDFAVRYLFNPLGISDLNWEVDRTGIPIGGWGLQLSSRDMAKLGYLYLHSGVWDGQQIISNQWVQTATKKYSAPEGTQGYGYQWWIYPSYDAYAARGRYGQTIFVDPEHDLIVVTPADLENHDQIFQIIEQFNIPSVKQ